MTIFKQYKMIMKEWFYMEIYNGTYCVYVHINKVNGKMYVGQTCKKPEYRWNYGEGYKNSSYFYYAIQKYGWDNFEHEIIASGLTKAEADNFEKLLIKILNSNNRSFGYNLTDGGEGCCGYHHTDETKEKLSESVRGERNPNYGKTCSEETRKKISIANSNPSKEIREKISKAAKKRLANPEEREKISRARKGKYIRENHPGAKLVFCVETGQIYKATVIAAEDTNIDITAIRKCCSGVNKTAGGCHWRYVYDMTRRDGTIVPGVISLGLITDKEIQDLLNGKE